MSKLSDRGDLEDRINAMANTYVRSRENVTLVIGISQGGEQSVFGFGCNHQANKSIPYEEILFEIGSITKIFTGVALADLVLSNDILLDAPIGTYLPPDTPLSPSASAITLKQLATHTSGLGRLPPNFDQTVQDEHDPYIGYAVNDLYQSLSEVRSRFFANHLTWYSNWGFGLLGHILACASNQPFEALLREKICTPLGMSDTVINPSPSQAQRLMPGHSPDGSTVANWSFAALEAAGALRSTMKDMLTFLDANLAAEQFSSTDIPREKTPHGKAYDSLAFAQKVHSQTWSGNMGLGWQIEDPGGQHEHYWHNGATGGYVSFLGVDKRNQVGVVLLSNYGDAFANDDTLDQMGSAILKDISKEIMS